MQYLPKLLLLGTLLLTITGEASASETVVINPTNKAALLDGSCGNDEWQVATEIELPAGVSINLMHDKDYFYICVKGKPEDITVLDLYIEHAETRNLHRIHLSAQMGESVLTNKKWEDASEKWVLKDYAGFWVPYSGLKDREKRQGPKFARGTHRQVQVSRNKFPGDSWNMMFGVSAINHEGNRNSAFFYPSKAIGKDKSTWTSFSFTE